MLKEGGRKIVKREVRPLIFDGRPSGPATAVASSVPVVCWARVSVHFLALSLMRPIVTEAPRA